MKPLTFETTLDPELPRLAWLAEVHFKTGITRVWHGRDVEIGDRWLVEGVWDGPFSAIGLQSARHFFGSGMIFEDGGVWLIPSRALVDRILYCRNGESLIASNSLPLILGFTGATLSESVDYRQEAMAILSGVDEYRTTFRVVHDVFECLHQLYFEPVHINATSCKRAPRHLPREFRDYADYVGALQGALDRIRSNCASPERRTHVRAYTTISTGYDSTAVSALVRDFPIEAAFTSRRSNSSILPWMSKRAAIDDGGPIASILGIETRYLDSQQVSRDELYFLAATAAEPELAFAAMATYLGEQSDVGIVFTGFHGDKVWDAHIGGLFLSRDIRRGDTSGLNLGEIRLKAGFFNVAVPFIFAEEMKSIAKLSQSEEMRPWLLNTDYDRPIPRRIVESAGVPRAYFGNRKKAIVQHYSFPKNESLRAMYRDWLSERHGSSYLELRVMEGLNRVLFLGARVIEVCVDRLGFRIRFARVQMIGSRIDLEHELHVWAVNELTRGYDRYRTDS